jgi:hypothetical protein
VTFPEYNKAFINVIKEINNFKNGETMVKMAITASTLIKQRVQEKGINAEGQRYKPYSTRPTLIGCKTFIQKSACEALLGSKPKRKQLEWRTVKGKRLAILQGGYKKIREIQGRQTDHVDFSVTNNMWNNTLVRKETALQDLRSKQSDHVRGIAIIGAKLDKEKKKLAGNTKRRGDILDLSVNEQGELKKSFNLDVLQIFKENGL